METIKNILKPGGKDDDNALYDAGRTDANKGRVAGEGSHFSHQHTDSGVGGAASPTTTSAMPTSGLTGSSATKTADPTTTTDPAMTSTTSHTGTAHQANLPDRSREAPVGQAVTTEGDRAFPLSNTGTGSTAEPHGHGGIASQGHINVDRTAAGIAPAAASAMHPTSTTHTHASNAPVGSTATGSTLPTSTSGISHGPSAVDSSHISSATAQQILSPAQPADDKCVDTVHGGSHVTRIAREIDPCYETEGLSGTTTSSGLASGTTHDATEGSRSQALAHGAAGAATATHHSTVPGTQSSGIPGAHSSAVTDSGRSVPHETSHHSGAAPVAALAGAGMGAAGAHAAQSHHDSNVAGSGIHDTRSAGPTASTAPATTNSGLAGTSVGGTAGAAHPYSAKAVDPRIDSAGHQAPAGTYGASATNQSTAPSYSTLDPAADHTKPRSSALGAADNQRAEPVSQTHDQTHDHTARNAALGGAAGAGAGAVAGHEFSKKEAENATKEHQKAEEHLQKEHEKEQKHHEKEVEKHDKEVEKDQKHHQKEIEKHNKEVEKEQKHHQKEIEKHNKEVEKQEAKEQKEAEKERKEREKAEKPGLIDRLLHRDGSKSDKHHGEEAAATGAIAGAGGAAVHEHNKLHKEPPAGYTGISDKTTTTPVVGSTGTTGVPAGGQTVSGGSTTNAPLSSSAGNTMVGGNSQVPPHTSSTKAPLAAGAGTAAVAGGSHHVPSSSSTNAPLPAGTTVPGTRYGSGHDEHLTHESTTHPHSHSTDPVVGAHSNTTAATASSIPVTTTHTTTHQTGVPSQVTGGPSSSHLAHSHADTTTAPVRSAALEPAHVGTGKYADQVTGGTGTTQLAHGTTSHIPTDNMVAGQGGSVAGVNTQTQYVEGPKAGTGNYAEQVTGGTGTTHLAQGQHDDVANPQKKEGVIGKIEGALGLK